MQDGGLELKYGDREFHSCWGLQPSRDSWFGFLSLGITNLAGAGYRSSFCMLVDFKRNYEQHIADKIDKRHITQNENQRSNGL